MALAPSTYQHTSVDQDGHAAPHWTELIVKVLKAKIICTLTFRKEIFVFWWQLSISSLLGISGFFKERLLADNYIIPDNLADYHHFCSSPRFYHHAEYPYLSLFCQETDPFHNESQVKIFTLCRWLAFTSTTLAGIGVTCS